MSAARVGMTIATPIDPASIALDGVSFCRRPFRSVTTWVATTTVVVMPTDVVMATGVGMTADAAMTTAVAEAMGGGAATAAAGFNQRGDGGAHV
jgi:hypothetical protein